MKCPTRKLYSLQVLLWGSVVCALGGAAIGPLWDRHVSAAKLSEVHATKEGVKGQQIQQDHKFTDRNRLITLWRRAAAVRNVPIEDIEIVADALATVPNISTGSSSEFRLPSETDLESLFLAECPNFKRQSPDIGTDYFLAFCLLHESYCYCHTELEQRAIEQQCSTVATTELVKCNRLLAKSLGSDYGRWRSRIINQLQRSEHEVQRVTHLLSMCQSFPAFKRLLDPSEVMSLERHFDGEIDRIIPHKGETLEMMVLPDEEFDRSLAAFPNSFAIYFVNYMTFAYIDHDRRESPGWLEFNCQSIGTLDGIWPVDFRIIPPHRTVGTHAETTVDLATTQKVVEADSAAKHQNVIMSLPKAKASGNE